MSALNNLLVLSTISCILVFVNTQSVHRRFEYKYSFKPPYLAQKDGSVPFWEYGGNAIASGESVRLAPSMRSQKGAIWSKHPLSFDWWEVDVMFKVTGRGRIGADGLAFWYTTQRGDYTGEVFGSSDRWNGLALIFDSFDNDNKHNNPYIMAVLNDGTKVFDHKSDGSTQLLSGCLRDFRNKPFPTRARIEYYLNTLTVYFHNGMTNNEADYELCFRAENVVLPRGGYFGLSAATGGLADDHDVIHLLTTSLHTTQQQGGQQISADEQQKLDREYQEYQQKLEQQKDQYRKDHPDEMKDKESEFDDWFESDGQREFRQIWQGVMALQDALRDVNKKVDEVIGKQTNSLSLLSAVYSHTQGQPIQPAAPGQPPAQMPSLPIGRHDWDGLVANNQIMINTIAELKGFIIEVARKSDALIAASGGAPATAGAINPQFLSEMRDSMHQLKQSVAGVAQRMSNAPQVVQQPMSSCQDVSCVSLTGLLVVVAAQLTLMFFYAVYKERKEAQAKKFF
ncbi:protein ERGIC-53 isoform X3 [Ostrinia furnacalis]|uniref:protein ERGIC-53 isoform X1 n=1 Tax=Ostrinia furnacalis TaxID=93504 RepID=UPI00103B41AD|nr:protein ERGIC-53 isoform X1 [Ostrinia furnacalis]XP_028177940.1 protein ERGIC-53 isoform X2 [Ostrinia furnacalis]XP_028177941.1 protein ERGIC-53 isoform X3 [Ostrinia furnacalis]